MRSFTGLSKLDRLPCGPVGLCHSYFSFSDLSGVRRASYSSPRAMPAQAPSAMSNEIPQNDEGNVAAAHSVHLDCSALQPAAAQQMQSWSTLPREARPVNLSAGVRAGLLAHSTVIRAAGSTALGGGRRGFGGTWNRGRDFPGGGGGSGFPQVIPDWSLLLHLVRSGVGVILTSPSLLVEGVRSGSRRRNAATASALAGGESGRNRGAQRPHGQMLRYAAGGRSLYGQRARPGRVLPYAGKATRAADGITNRAIHPHMRMVLDALCTAGEP